MDYIRLGMTKPEVEKLLGEPSSKSTDRVWYYEKLELFWWLPLKKKHKNFQPILMAVRSNETRNYSTVAATLA